jgi:hypothetical protein
MTDRRTHLEIRVLDKSVPFYPHLPVLQQLENCMCVLTMYKDQFIVMNAFGFMQATFTGLVFNCKICSL